MSWELESPHEADGFAAWLTDPEREREDRREGREKERERREREVTGT